MEKTNLGSSKSKYLLNFSFTQKRLSSKEDIGNSGQFNSSAFSKNSMSSNIISETSLEENYILLRKKSLLKRKSIGSIKIFYSEIIDLKLKKSDLSNLYSSIEIVYSKNGYSKVLICLSSSDSFAVRWFYDELVVRYSLFKSNLNEKRFDSDENNYINLDNSSSGEKKIIKSKESTLDDFMNKMNAEISEKRKKEIAKQMKFDRCSSGEY